jgi:hypothetical protein
VPILTDKLIGICSTGETDGLGSTLSVFSSQAVNTANIIANLEILFIMFTN